MKVLVTCDSYKDCLTASEVGESLIDGILSIQPEWSIKHIPNADGGEGSLHALEAASGLEKQWCRTYDPLVREINSYYLVDTKRNTAFIEMASASGIELLKPEERNCLRTTTYGTGIMMNDAISRGYDHLVFFIGGSATSEMGIGMAAGLGVEFFDKNNNKILIPRGSELNHIHFINVPDHLKKVHMTLICDVTNPLYGMEGAAHIYGPQKGCDQETIKILDTGMRELNQIMVNKFKIDCAHMEGAGAAGGIGAMCFYLFNTKMKSGGEFMFDILNIKNHFVQSDLIITGEGKMDSQTQYGKLVSRLGTMARKFQKKLIAVCGVITASNQDIEKMYVHRTFSISEMTGNAPYTSDSTKKNLKEIGQIIGSSY